MKLATKTAPISAKLGKKILFSFFVITLSTVIATQAADQPASINQNQVAPAQETQKSPVAVPVEQAALPKEVPKEIEKSSATPAAAAAAIASQPLEARKELSSIDTAKVSSDQSAAKVEGDKVKDAVDSESSKRKARAEPTATTGNSASTSAPAAESVKSETVKPSASEKTTKPDVKSSTPKAKGQSVKSAPKSKHQANLGTVTSTGSGGHYMSKHDAYSAIAEKHGALAQDAMKKSDKRQLHGFGGIQKASGGLGDVLSPFKGVTDSGLARTLGASMRSIMKSKYSVPAYVASALLGAVALMAFYESPISPLPVPALPEPPIGRFPPEMPNLPVGTQVPFRMNQQQQQQQYGQNYNQRSLNTLPNVGQQGYLNQQPQAPQVLFPGSISSSSGGDQGLAQQRQINAAGPVGQIAANLLSGKQVAQRKSGPDYDMSSSRSLFGSTPANKAGANVANHQKQPSSILSYLGLGGPSGAEMAASESAHHQVSSINSQQAALADAANTAANAVASSLDAKSNTGLSNSHLINKVKSIFTRAAAPGSSSSGSGISHSVSSNPYEPYQRMSFVQALIKDTAFIPGFLTPSRKSSSVSTGSSHSSASNKLQHSLTNALSASGNSPSARMQVGNEGTLVSSAQIQPAVAIKGPANKPNGSGHLGLARAADRIAHALLETFSSGVAQRNAVSPSNSNNQVDSASRKSSIDESSQSSLASATSLLSDIMSGYSAVASEQQQHQQQQQQQQQQQVSHEVASSKSAPAPQQVQVSQQQQQPQPDSQQASARSLEIPSASQDEDHKQLSPKSPSQSTSSSSSNQNSEVHSRKTRSIGYEYPVDSNQELIRREQQPSKAAQINNVIDFVADSYTQNRLLFNFVMNQVGLSQAVPYVEQILGDEHH